MAPHWQMTQQSWLMYMQKGPSSRWLAADAIILTLLNKAGGWQFLWAVLDIQIQDSGRTKRGTRVGLFPTGIIFKGCICTSGWLQP